MPISNKHLEFNASRSKFIDIDPTGETGLEAAFRSIFPIKAYSGSSELQFVSYRLGEPLFDVKECQIRGVTYSAPLRVKLRLVVYDTLDQMSEDRVIVILNNIPDVPTIDGPKTGEPNFPYKYFFNSSDFDGDDI